MLKGIVIAARLTPLVIAKTEVSVWVSPGVFEPFDEFPEGAIERRRHTSLLTPLHNRAVHEIDFGLTFCKNILKHAGAMFPRSVRTLLNHLATIAIQLHR